MLSDPVSCGLSIFGAGAAAYQLVTGHTLASNIEDIKSELKKTRNELKSIKNKVWHIDRQKVWNVNHEAQNFYSNQEKIVKIVGSDLKSKLKSDLVMSKIIYSPEKLQKHFHDNPQNILHNIQPLNIGKTDNQMNGPSFIPVIFKEWEQDFIGWIKVGYLEDYIGCRYDSMLTNKVAFKSAKIQKNYKGLNNIEICSNNKSKYWKMVQDELAKSFKHIKQIFFDIYDKVESAIETAVDIVILIFEILIIIVVAIVIIAIIFAAFEL